MTDWTARLRGAPPPPRDLILPTEAWRARGGSYGRYRDDPVGFARDVLGMTLWDGQEAMLRAVQTQRKTAVRSGHKIGKSTGAAAIALWRTLAREDARTVITAPTNHQVKNIIWRELRRWHERAALPGEPALDPGTGYQYRRSEVIGLTTNEPERMAGVSGADLLYIVDEASGYDEAIFEAIEGNMAGGGRLLLISNPTQTSGTFYRAFTTERHLWHGLHISSTATPNAREGRIVIPGLATREWIEEKRGQWGPNSPLYQVRVEGNFPAQAANAVIGLAVVETAQARWEELPDDAPLRLGVDVARFGDDATIIQPVRGDRALPAREFRQFDNVEVAGFVVETARLLRRGEERVRVKVDDGGLGGGVVDVLRHSEEARRLGLVILPVNAGEGATDPAYMRRRDELWFGLRDWLKTGGIPDDALLAADLVSPTYTFAPSGRLVVESKKDLKKRLGRSPDHADALALAVYEPAASGEHFGW